LIEDIVQQTKMALAAAIVTAGKQGQG